MSSNPLPQQRTEDLAVLNAAMNLVPETYEEFKGHFSSSVSLSRKQVAGKALAELGIDPDVFYSGIAAANKPGLEEEGSSEANGGFSPAPRMALCINTNSTSSAFPSLGCPVDEFEEVGLEGEVVGGRMGRETPRGVAGSLKIDSLTDDEDLGPDDDHWLQPSLPLRDTGYRTDAVHDFEIDAEFDYDNVACSGRVEPGICLPVARPVQGVQSSSESSDVEDAVAMDG